MVTISLYAGTSGCFHISMHLNPRPPARAARGDLFQSQIQLKYNFPKTFGSVLFCSRTESCNLRPDSSLYLSLLSSNCWKFNLGRRRLGEKEKEMHLWPSLTIRDSFKLVYLRKLEWNISRMEREKGQSSNNQKLLDKVEPVANGEGAVKPNSETRGGVLVVCKEMLMVLSCCYCCFCCGGNWSPYYFYVRCSVWISVWIEVLPSGFSLYVVTYWFYIWSPVMGILYWFDHLVGKIWAKKFVGNLILVVFDHRL